MLTFPTWVAQAAGSPPVPGLSAWLDARSDHPDDAPAMRGIPTSQIRQPLLSPVALASFVPTCAAVFGYVACAEFHGRLRYVVVAAALVLVVYGVRLTWRVARRETERLR
jgi:hypothetical protein